MENTVIKNLNPEMGSKILKYWKSKGFNTIGFTGAKNEEQGHVFIYYGVINGKFDFYNLEEVNRANALIIDLPKEKKAKFTEKEVKQLMKLARKNYCTSVKILFEQYKINKL
jgi:uncharacterized OsmC-like protein